MTTTTDRLTDDDLARFEVKGRMGDFKISGVSVRALVAEVQEHRAAAQRVRDEVGHFLTSEQNGALVKFTARSILRALDGDQ